MSTSTPRVRTALATGALLVLGGVLVAIWSAIAALTLCLNETPSFAEVYQQALPIVGLGARGILDVVNQVVPGLSPPGAPCDPTALARALTLAGLVYLAGLGVLSLSIGCGSTRWAGSIIALVALVCQVMLLLMPGLLSSDVLDYTSYGRIMAEYDANPYVVPRSAFPADPLTSFGDWQDQLFLYGPLWARVADGLARALPAGDPVQLVLAYKLVAFATQVVSLGLVWWLTGRWQALGVLSGARVAAFALYAWNPAVLLEFVGGAHTEAVMSTSVLAAMALLTLAVHYERHSQKLWLGAILNVALGVLIKFVPAPVGAFAVLAWLRRQASLRQAVRRGIPVALLLAGLTLVLAWPWLDSTAILRPVFLVGAGGHRYHDAWQDAPAEWITVRVLAPLDQPPETRTDVARSLVWAVTRTLFVVYVVFEVRHFWQRAGESGERVLQAIAAASARVMMLVILLLLTQILAWYFTWPLPLAALLGWRHPVAKAAVALSLTFLPAYYLREFQSYGTFYLPIYLGVALALVALFWVVDVMSPSPTGSPG